MKLVLKFLQVYTPGFLKKQVLVELYRATANAFRRAMPSVNKLSFEEQLQSYAVFTNVQAERALEHGENLSRLQARLHHNAHDLGQRLRERFGLKQMQEAMDLARILYRIIGIDFLGSSAGDITIERCYFSPFYSPQVCKLISALDEGLLAGLAGGGKLTFSQRITQGSAACKACFFQKTCLEGSPR